MDATVALYDRVRNDFPRIAASADRFHERRFGDALDVGVEYAWFEALADALNEDMRRGVPYAEHQNMCELLASAYTNGQSGVQQCIDVSFVENLFWQVPSTKAGPYWKKLPIALRQLYLGFHGREP
jgi:hypothetical protein